MKTILFSVLFMLTSISSIFSQQALSSLDIFFNPVTVADNPNGSLDCNSSHTIEVWFKTSDVTSDQKLFNKINNNFLDGYILGIENGTVKYEIFDITGAKEELIAGTLLPNQWTHLAATFSSSSMKIYINGVLAGEKSVSLGSIGYVTSPLMIGTAAWDVGLLNFTGQIDELRFWHQELSAETINLWMHKSVNTDDHPDKATLNLYHKFDEGSGSTVADLSTQTTNSGTFSTETWTTSTVPFAGGHQFINHGPAIGGIWVGHNDFSVAGLTISGVNLTGDQSTLVDSGNDFQANTLCNFGITSVDSTTCEEWVIFQQGNPTINLSYDFSNYNLTNVESIVLLESESFSDFSNANVISGTMNGNIFEVSSHTISATNTNVYYFFGINFTPPNAIYDLGKNKIDFSISPNPSNGQFQMSIKSELAADYQLRITDYTGKLILEKQFQNVVGHFQDHFDLSFLPNGIYSMHLQSEDGIATERLVIQK